MKKKDACFSKYPDQQSFLEKCPIGEKMIKKMGWEAGKGLGINNKGITECLKVRVIKEKKGIGFKENNTNFFNIHNNDFENILNNLNESSKIMIQDLKSEKVETKKSIILIKNRHRYNKYTKNKDVTKYTDADLLGITGISQTD
ncbi:unnamed protein product [Gordionus sp. m RMFG-2023]|uniref:PIN2/TERF1-interacting telomerase inhibitor 1-like n=1 Tax=Gordionus sp. m RMFG-2023 TaxID=3053472 RepID=UPI0030E3BCE2